MELFLLVLQTQHLHCPPHAHHRPALGSALAPPTPSSFVHLFIQPACASAAQGPTSGQVLRWSGKDSLRGLNLKVEKKVFMPK